MANEKNEKKTVTGLDTATNRNDAEYDLLSALFAAADYKNNEIHEVDIKRNGNVLFVANALLCGENEAVSVGKLYFVIFKRTYSVLRTLCI